MCVTESMTAGTQVTRHIVVRQMLLDYIFYRPAVPIFEEMEKKQVLKTKKFKIYFLFKKLFSNQIYSMSMRHIVVSSLYMVHITLYPYTILDQPAGS